MRCLLVMLCASIAILMAAGKADEPRSIVTREPADNAVLSTPLTGILKWLPVDGAASYTVEITGTGTDKPVTSIEMYWSAWNILFSTWLYAPPAKDNLAVSNVIGMPTWAGWGSTMVLDTAFILQFARYGNAAYPFITALDNCYARQHENGFICRETDNNNWEVLSGWPVNPPLLAWAEWRYYQVTGDLNRLREVYLPLVKQYEWYMLYQRRSNGAYWTNGLNESDDLTRNQYAHSFISTTCVQGMSADILAQMSSLVGRPDMAAWFEDEYESISKLVNDIFWDERFRLYNDLGIDGKPITRTPEGHLCKHWHSFWPLLTGIATKERAGYLAEHILDKSSFNRSSGTASLSADSFGYIKHGRMECASVGTAWNHEPALREACGLLDLRSKDVRGRRYSHHC